MTAWERVRALTMSPLLVMPPSAMMRTPAFSRGLSADIEGGELRDADAGDDAGGADGAGPLADLDGVGAALGEILDALAAGDVSGDDGAVRGMLLADQRTVSPTPLLKPWAVETATTSTPRSTRAPTWARMRSRSSSPVEFRVAETAAPQRSRNWASRAGLSGACFFLHDALDIAEGEEAAETVVVVHDEEFVDADVFVERIVGGGDGIVAEVRAPRSFGRWRRGIMASATLIVA